MHIMVVGNKEIKGHPTVCSSSGNACVRDTCDSKEDISAQV